MADGRSWQLMIVYREQRRSADPRALLTPIRRQLEEMKRHVRPTRDAIVHALIDAGEWASGVADARAPHHDGVDAVTEAALSVVVPLARAVEADWLCQEDEIDAAVEQATVAVRSCSTVDLPSSIQLSVSEGFAYYSLGPELYAEAARAWSARSQPPVVWCIGLRTIGLTLAAVASAALERRGIVARVISLRPRGHPFNREPRIDHDLAQRLTGNAHAWWLVVDEGPGISGSSMAGTARALSRLGISPERIVLMPSYVPDVNRMSEASRAIWKQHQVCAASFEDTWLRTGRFGNAWGARSLLDVSAGRWRRLLQTNDQPPAVNSQHERRKFIVHRDGERAIIKFSGYGHYGRERSGQAMQAADEGVSPRLNAAREGWMEQPWSGEPFIRSDVKPSDLSRLAQYLSFVSRREADVSVGRIDSLLEMAITNTRAVCGDVAASAIERLRPADGVRAVFVDGHLRPHEWIRQRGQLLKTDAVEHGDDHFFPGPSDVAWDVAGAIEEWRLGRDATAFLLDQYVTLSGDRTVMRRLPFYRVAYLAFRAAYTAFSRDQLAGTSEAARFNSEFDFYRTRLGDLVTCAC